MKVSTRKAASSAWQDWIKTSALVQAAGYGDLVEKYAPAVWMNDSDIRRQVREMKTEMFQRDDNAAESV